MVKEAESLGGSVISATGAIYAMRRELFRAGPRRGHRRLRDLDAGRRGQGRRLVFEPTAIALEPVAGSGAGSTGARSGS